MPTPLPDLPPEVELEIRSGFEAGGDAQKAVVAKYTAPPWSWSVNKVYRIARSTGWVSGRKARADRGAFRIAGVDDALIEKAALIQKEATRKKTGKGLMVAKDVRTQLVLNGDEAAGRMSDSTMNRHLRRKELSHASLEAGNPAIQMRSLHPNHIHFLDASVCVQFDFRRGTGHRMVTRDMQTSHYKNKPAALRSIRNVLIRWIVVDHRSGAFHVDYTFSPGENTEDMLSVLLDAWAPKADPARNPFHGVPFMLGLDPGAANTSHAVKHLCKRLGVELYVHEPGNSRASGVVENLHGIWERRFEYELLLKPAESLEDLRARARDRALSLNSERHSRHRRTRFGMWMAIKPDQLRIMPPLEHCRALATGKPERRTPDERLRIRVGGVEYQLSAPARKGQPVWIDRNPWQVGEWNAWIEAEGRGREAVLCERIIKDDAGFDVTAPVFGEDRYRRHPDTPATAMGNLSDDERAKRLGGFEPKPTAHLVPEVDYMPKRGTPMIPEIPAVPPIPAEHVRRRVRERLGLERLNPLQVDMITALLAGREAITESELDALVAQFEVNLRVTEGGATVSTLRIVGGRGATG